jgi:RimJ/RimL family protein N-acetyltransferase
LGGADKDNVTTKVIDSLKQLKDRDLQIKIISGHANMYKEKLNSLLSQISANFELLSSVKEMPSLMDWADMAISAAGSTCYELAFMGLPSVLITIADNQKGIGERLERNGAAIHIGAAYEIDCDILRDTISSLLSDKSRRKKMSRNCINLVDGYGAEKLVEIIGVLGENEFEIKNFLRRASERDCHSILQLANDPEVRKSSFSHDLISYDDHYSWYMDKLNSRKSCIFIVDVGGQLCGQVRYEKEGDFAIVHFSVAPAFRGRGLGRKMIEATVKDACGVLETCLIRGLVISSNRPSINTFIKAGFKKVGDRNLSGTDCVIFEKIIKSINQG